MLNRSKAIVPTNRTGPSGRNNPRRCRLGTGFRMVARKRRVGWQPMESQFIEPQSMKFLSKGLICSDGLGPALARP